MSTISIPPRFYPAFWKRFHSEDFEIAQKEDQLHFAAKTHLGQHFAFRFFFYLSRTIRSTLAYFLTRSKTQQTCRPSIERNGTTASLTSPGTAGQKRGRREKKRMQLLLLQISPKLECLARLSFSSFCFLQLSRLLTNNMLLLKLKHICQHACYYSASERKILLSYVLRTAST